MIEQYIYYKKNLRTFLIIFYIALFSVNVSGQYNWYSDYDVKYYKIDVYSSDTSTYIAGNTTITAEILKVPLDSFRFELLSTISIDSIIAADLKMNYKRWGDITSIPIAQLSLGNEIFSVTVYYHGLLNNIYLIKPIR